MGIPWGFPRDFAVGMGWVWGLKSNQHGSPEYLRNGARYDQGYYDGLIGSCIYAFDWQQGR